MRFARLVVSCALAVQLSPAMASVIARTGPVMKMASESAATSPARLQYQGVMLVAQSAVWNGRTSCDSTWAYFNQAANPQFVAMLVAARTSGLPVEVVVDDSLPRIDGFCQIVSISY